MTYPMFFKFLFLVLFCISSLDAQSQTRYSNTQSSNYEKCIYSGFLDAPEYTYKGCQAYLDGQDGKVNELGKANAYLQIGSIEKKQKELDKATESFQKALVSYRKSVKFAPKFLYETDSFLSGLYEEMGDVELLKKDLKKANQFYLQSLNYHGSDRAFAKLGYLYFLMKDIPASNRYFEQYENKLNQSIASKKRAPKAVIEMKKKELIKIRTLREKISKQANLEPFDLINELNTK